MSYRPAAVIASALQQDVRIVTDEDIANVFDISKVRRSRQNILTSFREEIWSFENIVLLYFDGTRDKTLHQEKVGPRTYKSIVIEEHISLIEEFGSIRIQYVGHTTQTWGCGKNLARFITTVCSTHDIQLHQLGGVGRDGSILVLRMVSFVIWKLSSIVIFSGWSVNYISTNFFSVICKSILKEALSVLENILKTLVKCEKNCNNCLW